MIMEEKTIMTMEEVLEHKYDNTTDAPAIYVGTYAKYNDGNLYGMWLDLTSFYDYEEFMDCCRALHSDEEDPEFMSQDYENFPEEWYSESGIDEETFDKIKEYGELEEYDRDMWEAYIDEFGDYADFSTIQDKCHGKWDSEEDFAQNQFDELEAYQIPEHLRYYFDIEKYAEDLFDYDYTMSNGYVFWNY
jgi:antirestriction protein